jgi:hypothetical protein
MANESGQVYGLTILSPIIEDERLDIDHTTQLRWYLSTLPRDNTSPFAKVSSTYLARLVVLDDVVFVGKPACEEHLKSRYLIFETNFDGDLDTYLRSMASEVGEFVDAVWKHCVGYPGTGNFDAFVAYMKKCQLQTTFFFADVNDRTVKDTLRALQTQSALTHFVERNQGKPPAEIQRLFGIFLERLKSAPAPLPGGRADEKSVTEGRPHD